MKPEDVEKVASMLEKLAESLPADSLADGQADGPAEKTAGQEDPLDSGKVLDFLKFYGNRTESDGPVPDKPGHAQRKNHD